MLIVAKFGGNAQISATPNGSVQGIEAASADRTVGVQRERVIDGALHAISFDMVIPLGDNTTTEPVEVTVLYIPAARVNPRCLIGHVGWAVGYIKIKVTGVEALKQASHMGRQGGQLL
jgi:hypothetical protein